MTLPQGAEKVRAVRDMFDRIAPRYDLVNRVMTFGLDVRWRRRTVASLGLPSGAMVLDVACGTGDLCRTLTGAGYHSVGVDLSWGMLAHARTEAPLLEADGLRLPVRDGAADGITSGFALRNVADLGALFREAGRVVRPGGRVALLDVAEPRQPVLRWGHRIYFGKVVPVIGGLLSDKSAYRYLPASVSYLPAPDAMLDLLRDAGFVDVQRHLLSGGIVQLLTATREGTR